MRVGNLLDLSELAAAPGTPPAGREVLYSKSTGLFYKNSAGAEVGPLAAAPTNYVDLSTTQTVGGAKTFSAALTGSVGVYDGANRVYSAGNPPPAGGGGSSVTVTSQSTAYTAVSGNVVLATGTFTVTLPAATANAQVTVKNTGTGTVTVSRAGTALIDGAATATLALQYQSLSVVSDGTNWFVI